MSAEPALKVVKESEKEPGRWKRYIEHFRRFIESGQLAKLSPAAAKVYMVLYKHADAEKLTCYPGQALMAKLTGLHKGSVIRAISELIDHGLLKRSRGTGGRKSTYELLTVAPALLRSPPKHSRASATQRVAPARPRQSRQRDSEGSASATRTAPYEQRHLTTPSLTAPAGENSAAVSELLKSSQIREPKRSRIASMAGMTVEICKHVVRLAKGAEPNNPQGMFVSIMESEGEDIIRRVQSGELKLDEYGRDISRPAPGGRRDDEEDHDGRSRVQ